MLKVCERFHSMLVVFAASWWICAAACHEGPQEPDEGVVESMLDNPPPLPGDDGPPWELPPQDLNKRCRRGCVEIALDDNEWCNNFCARWNTDDEECIACYEEASADFQSCLLRCNVLYPPQ